MRSVLARIERIEQALDPGPCPVCRGRTTIIAYREDEPPPDSKPCSCGLERVILWRSQAPEALDEALQCAGARERPSCSIPLWSEPTAGGGCAGRGVPGSERPQPAVRAE